MSLPSRGATLPSDRAFRSNPEQTIVLSDSLPLVALRGFSLRRLRIRRIAHIQSWQLVLALALLLTVIGTGVMLNRPGGVGLYGFHERQMNTTLDAPFMQGCGDPIAEAAAHSRENAAFVMLARNSEVEMVLHSISSLELHFNQWFEYPYVFLNDEPFTDVFKEKIRQVTSAKVTFGQVNSSMWGFPSWADQELYREAIAQQGERGIQYGGVESYHHMCRFFSGFFFNHPLTKDLEFYWRVEPQVTFFCDLTYDPFRLMKERGKVYGFVIAIKERLNTIPNLFQYALAWKREHRIRNTSLWSFVLRGKSSRLWQILSKYLSSTGRSEYSAGGIPDDAYNMCHFWSNFEIARVDFFQSALYSSFFSDLDKTGGFWLERWGDAPIHSLAAAMLLEADQVHYFRDIGYQHTSIMHCPANAPNQSSRPPMRSQLYPSLPETWDEPKQGGSGCRCTCPQKLEEVEWKEGTCMNEWAEVMGGWLDDWTDGLVLAASGLPVAR